MNGARAVRRLLALGGISGMSLGLAGPLTAQTLFTDVTEEAGLHRFRGTEARTVVFVDFDNDGLQDVFITENGYVRHESRIGLFHNTGDGRFTDQTFLVPDVLHTRWRGGGQVLGDYDNDGDEDLFLSSWEENESGDLQPGGALLRNDRGVFVRTDPGSDLTENSSPDDAVWLDYDRDGYLDLYAGYARVMSLQPLLPNRLLRNQGDGTFVDRTAAAGLDIIFRPTRGGSGGGMAAGDFNGDGWTDLYLGVNQGPNRLFLNTGQGTFDDATSSAIADSGEAFTVSVGDIDNDGDLDLFQSAGGVATNLLYRSPMLMNLGDGEFIDVTESVGLHVLGANSSGSAFLDLDNDGDLDLVVGLSPSPNSYVLLNDGTGVFVDETASSGLVDYGAYTAVGDYDEDGFGDLLFSSFSRELTALYHNNGNGNHWLRVELVGVESNRSAIGARVSAAAGDLTQMRQILGGVGRQQDERVAHFGLGDRTKVDRLEIRWPSGQRSVLTDVPADQKIRVFEGREGYHRVEPTRWVSAPIRAVVQGTTSRIAAAVRPALFEAEGRVTRVTADLSELGGPAELPLDPGEGGTYRLDTKLQTDLPVGPYTMWVNIEQRTSLGDHWVRLSQEVVVAPAEDMGVYGQTVEGGWTWSGHEQAQLTSSSGEDFGPSWSPDGTRIAFNSNRDDNWEIYVIGVDGSDPVNLTRHPSSDRYPRWSPDGTKIAFHSDRDEDPKTYDIFVMDADGGNPTNLTASDGDDAMASWSPDGTRIAFWSERDGNREVYVMDTDGGNPINLTRHLAEDLSPAWSPDGTRIAFCTNRDGNYGIYVMNADGGNPVQLTRHPARDGYPAWSPDGTQIAFESVRNSTGTADIYVLSSVGTGLSALRHSDTYDMDGAWSPDGKRVVFASNRRGNMDLFILDLAESDGLALDPAQSETTFTGSKALAVHAGAEWWLSCRPAEPFDGVGYGALHFAFRSRSLAASSATELSAGIDGKRIDLLAEGWVDLTTSEWQVVEIPLARLGLKGPIPAIDFSGDFTGTFYLDDVRLTAMRSGPTVTAVGEEVGEALPTAPRLAQNFPNPFNAGTVVRFSLPEPGEVRLTVYNLAGQKVVTLAQEPRAAGPHAIRWDGRDDDGRALASGIYLYRLVAGDDVLTRKLALIR